jgi:hypothetical protein
MGPSTGTFKLCSATVATKCSSHFGDGTGVGHIFWYHLETDGMDLGEQKHCKIGM